jgi:ubiquinol-cytochrome c reductase cytochrome b subunit/menaquinol-cytochrome c reductase cytochrome b/c subunit
LNARERDQYLREYSILKSQGKPFFPYADLKDSVMACIVLAVIIFMAVMLGAELGPKADPTTTTYVPRPEWYFFFLFELLRVIKPPALVFVATMGLPTLCLVLLLALPFFDRNPERHPFKRPIATLAGITTIFAMGYLTLLGALAGSPTEIDVKVAPQFEEGKNIAASSGCLGCHRFKENGNPGPGPELTTIGTKLKADAIERTLLNPTPPMPSYASLKQQNPEKFDKLIKFLASLNKPED